jgi:hypothetical protein
MRVTLAYLDPVTGSALVQMVLAGMAVVGLGYQYFRKGLTTTWSRIRRTTTKSDESTTPVDV